MELNPVGRSGLVLSAVGLGCNNFGSRLDEDESKAVVVAALDAGITHFDTADIYGGGRSEEFLGRALGGSRDDVIIGTKVGLPMHEGHRAGGSRRYIMKACEASLRRLGTDYVDIYYHHIYDPGTPLDETMTALADLVRSGKARYIASSNYAAWQIVDAAHIGRHLGTSYIATQCEWNMLMRSAEAEIVPACRHMGVAAIPYFPLASGFLTGKYRAGAEYPSDSRLVRYPFYAGVATEDNLAKVERARAFAEARGLTMLELAMTWLASQPTVPAVIAGAMSAEQVKSNVNAIRDLFDSSVLEEIDAVLA